MGKFRSILKGQTRGKRWAKGQSSSSNPETQKHRNVAKSRFFQENLGSPSGLTLNALRKHDAIQSYSGGSVNKTLGELTASLKDVELGDNVTHTIEDATSESVGDGESHGGTFKTFQTFASDWSECTNTSFSKLLRGFRADSAFQKEMLAILAAITEVINERGGTQSSTEYFAALMETLSATEDENGIHATLSLLTMGIKTVSQPVLRAKLSDAGKIFMGLLETYHSTINQNLLRCLLGCLSVLLRAQEISVWHFSNTMQMFDSILAFCTHSKPKVRKAAQHAVIAILRGSSFMLEPNGPKVHPAASRVFKFCMDQCRGDSIATSQTTVLHTLTMLKDVLPGFNKDDIKAMCETLLSIMTASNVLIRTCAMQTLHSLFQASSKAKKEENDSEKSNEDSDMEDGDTVFKTSCSNLTSALAAKLLKALYDYRPDKSDVRQTQAWVTVMQQGHVCLASLDLTMCMLVLPQFVETCAGDLWLSDRAEVANSATNALKDVLYDCVKPACATPDLASQHSVALQMVFKAIGKALSTPFGHAAIHVVHVLAVCFEVGGEHCGPMLSASVKTLGLRRDPVGAQALPSTIGQIEHAIGAAVKSMGPELVLQCIPLVDESGEISVDRSWLLPVLKDKIQGSTIEFFAGHILDLATKCKRNWEMYAASGDKNLAHTYELLCSQLWGLLPGFFNKPIDVKENFKKIAKVLGSVLGERPELRGPVLQGLRKLISGANADDVLELARFAKNFLPLLLNIFTTPVKGSHAEGQRLAAMETIQIYLTIAPQDKREEFFTNALIRLKNATDSDQFLSEALLDVLRVLVPYQTKESLVTLFDGYILQICDQSADDKTKDKTDKPKPKVSNTQQKKAYRLVEEILKSTNGGCVEYIKENRKRIQKVLLKTLNSSSDNSKASRLRCLDLLIASQPQLDSDSKLIRSAVTEAVLSVKDINKKCRDSAYKLLLTIGEVLQDKSTGLAGFAETLIAGLAGTPNVTSSTLLALSSITYNFSGALGMETLKYLLEQACTLLASTCREVTSAAISYLHVYCKALPAPLIANALPVIMKGIAAMPDDCRRHARLELGRMLDRLSRKYGADTLTKLAPSQDTVTHKRLRNLRKIQARKKRLREQKANDKPDDDQNIKPALKSIEEILADSDSDLEDNDLKAKRGPKKKTSTSRSSHAWIQETENNFVDLADASAISKITSTKPGQSNATVQKQEPNRGFKTSHDGRLIIEEESEDSDDNSGTNKGLAAKKKKRGPKFGADSDSDKDEEMEAKPTLGKRKRGAHSTKSGASGMSEGPPSKYQAGGQGIHRPVASSVRSGMGSSKSGFGSEYRSNKATGDVQKKGRPDPYAYVPLTRNSLNKRKKAKNAGQFKGIVKGARKGSAAGAKRLKGKRRK